MEKTKKQQRVNIPEDTAEYVILAAYPGADEVPQVVRIPFGRGGAHPSYETLLDTASGR